MRLSSEEREFYRSSSCGCHMGDTGTRMFDRENSRGTSKRDKQVTTDEQYSDEYKSLHKILLNVRVVLVRLHVL